MNPYLIIFILFLSCCTLFVLWSALVIAAREDEIMEKEEQRMINDIKLARVSQVNLNHDTNQ